MTAPNVIIQGACDPRFHRVRDRFVENFSEFGETGAALAISIDRRPVVDIWAGFADAARTRPWQRDTIANVYSTTKGITAMCAHRLVDQGKLDLDAPVAKYWPEFAAAGKDTIPVRYLLSHQAGLPTLRAQMSPTAVYEWDTMTAALAAEEPWWPPGTRHGYHALTYGWLVGEVVRRTAGKSVGRYWRDEIAGPLGIDFHLGLPADQDRRTADLIPPPPFAPELLEMFGKLLQDPNSLLGRVFANPPLAHDAANSREWRAAEIPAGNGHTNARALARLYGVLACGGTQAAWTLMSRESIHRALTEQCGGPDAVLLLHTRFGLGFMLSTPSEKMGPNSRAFGHGGMGGSLGFADPDARLGFGYIMNEMHLGPWLIDPRVAAIIAALYDCL